MTLYFPTSLAISCWQKHRQKDAGFLAKKDVVTPGIRAGTLQESYLYANSPAQSVPLRRTGDSRPFTCADAGLSQSFLSSSLSGSRREKTPRTTATDGRIPAAEGDKATTKDSSPSPPPSPQTSAVCCLIRPGSQAPKPPSPLRSAVSRRGRRKAIRRPRPRPLAQRAPGGRGAGRPFQPLPARPFPARPCAGLQAEGRAGRGRRLSPRSCHRRANKAMGPGIQSKQQHFYANESSRLDPAACGKLERKSGLERMQLLCPMSVAGSNTDPSPSVYF